MSTPEEDDLIAAEYVLGTLPAPERRAAKARLEVDGAFAARVRDWEGRLAPLNDAFPEAAVPDLLPAIEAQIFPTPPKRRRGWGWGWLAGAVSAGAVAAALVLALGLADLGRAPLPAPTPALTAELVGDTGLLAFAATFSAANLEIRQSAGPSAPEGRVYQAWAIGADGVPSSLGLLDAPALIVTFDGAEGLVLAVSLEPEGGAPGPVPSGPVLATGVLN